MRSVSDFTPVWASDRQSRKRKRPSDLDDLASDDDSSQSDSGEVSNQRDESTLPKSRSDPFFVAGHDPNQPLPSAPFRHGSGENARGNRKPRSTSTIGDTGQQSLRQRHLAVMTSILHTSLLRGDFARAGRAWRAMLRSDHDGRLLDLRQNGQWGIGAELLLRNNSRRSPFDETPSNKGFESFTHESFKAAKEYYEQLIVQYPYQRQNANATNTLTFYPAMFGIMIVEATEISRRAIQALDEATPERSSPTFDDEPSDHDRNIQTAEIRKSETESADMIAARLDEILISPPYDKFVPLLQLRAMVGLWLADLHDTLSKLTIANEEGDENQDYYFESYSSRIESDRSKEKSAKEKRKAQQYLARVVKNGGTLPEIIKDLLPEG